MKRFGKYLACAILGLIGVASNIAKADDYGCQVLLCLASPHGPREFTECQPPIDRLFAGLAKMPPDPFPICEMSGAGNYARQVTAAYDLCPTGTTAAPAGQNVQVGRKKPGLRPDAYSVSTGYVLAGGINQSEPGVGYCGPGGCGGRPWDRGPRACVGTLQGNYTDRRFVGGYIGYETTSAYVYDNIIWLDAVANPRAIDVYVDGSIYTRVRW